MDAATFRQCLLDDGYTEQFERELAPDTLLDEHRHAWDSRLYVLRGTLEFTQGGQTRLLQVGDWCEVVRDALHTERYGAQGCRVLIGRRMPEAGQGLLHPLGNGLTAMLTPGMTLLLSLLTAGSLLAGCAELGYDWVHQAQRQQCLKEPQPGAHVACLEANTVRPGDYQRYEQQRATLTRQGGDAPPAAARVDDGLCYQRQSDGRKICANR